MTKIDEFKEFVKKNPSLLKSIKTGDMTWQKYYEMYDMYGEDKNVWNDYLGNKTKFSEVGYCHMEKTSYNMKLCDDFEKIEDLVVYQSFDGAGGL